MGKQRYIVHKMIEDCDISSDLIDSYVTQLVKEGRPLVDVTLEIQDNGRYITHKEAVDLLNEYDDFKTELTEILQREYAHLTKGMIECGREEDWVGYRAFQLERSPIIRIARKFGIGLNG